MLMDMQEALQKRLDEKEAALTTAGEELARQRNRAWQAEQALEDFKTNVTDVLKEAIKDEVIEREAAIEFAERLGVKAPVRLFAVTLQVEVTVEGVEAEDADDAEEKIRNVFDVQLGGGWRDDVTFETHDFTVDRTNAEEE